jgi:hypothetical protein
MPRSDKFLRLILRLDAATCAATGLLLIIGSGFIEELTQIPANLSFFAGSSLVPIALFIGFTATRPVLASSLVWLIIAGNALWVAASLWLIFAREIAPNTIGYAFIIAQAAAVALLAELEFFGLRRASPASASPSNPGPQATG